MYVLLMDEVNFTDGGAVTRQSILYDCIDRVVLLLVYLRLSMKDEKKEDVFHYYIFSLGIIH